MKSLIQYIQMHYLAIIRVVAIILLELGVMSFILLVYGIYPPYRSYLTDIAFLCTPISILGFLLLAILRIPKLWGRIIVFVIALCGIMFVNLRIFGIWSFVDLFSTGGMQTIAYENTIAFLTEDNLSEWSALDFPRIDKISIDSIGVGRLADDFFFTSIGYVELDSPTQSFIDKIQENNKCIFIDQHLGGENYVKIYISFPLNNYQYCQYKINFIKI